MTTNCILTCEEKDQIDISAKSTMFVKIGCDNIVKEDTKENIITKGNLLLDIYKIN